jgi:hypothetical protein
VSIIPEPAERIRKTFCIGVNTNGTSNEAEKEADFLKYAPACKINFRPKRKLKVGLDRGVF